MPCSVQFILSYTVAPLYHDNEGCAHTIVMHHYASNHCYDTILSGMQISSEYYSQLDDTAVTLQCKGALLGRIQDSNTAKQQLLTKAQFAAVDTQCHSKWLLN